MWASCCKRWGNWPKHGQYYDPRPRYQRKGAGEEHPDTATSLNNMGGLLQAMGELAEARPYYARALAIREKVLGAEHPHTATSLNNMGALLDEMGDWPNTRHARAPPPEKVLGAEHRHGPA